MKKILSVTLAVILIISSCLTLTACHGSKGLAPFEVPETFDESKDYEITFWAKNDTNKTQVNIYEKAIADFEKLYPNIHVNIRLYTDYSRIYNDVITNISTQTTPNVCITYPDHIATYITGVNIVAPLDAVMTDSKYGLAGSELRFDSPAPAEIVGKFRDECIIDGTTYAIPFMRSTEACYINKTYVEALGYTIPDVLTWDWIWEVADAATAKDKDGTYIVNGQNIMIPFIYKSTDNMMIQQLMQKGAFYSSPDGKIGLFHEETRDLLFTIRDHVKKGSFSTFKISSYPANFLNAGQCIFAIDSTAGSTWMGTDAPLLDISADKLVEFETVVRTIPQFDTENQKMISQGPSICIFNKQDPQEVLASWLFAQFLLTNDVQIAYAETEGYAPVTTKAQSDPIYIDYLSRGGEDNSEHYYVKIDATRLLIEHTDDTFTTPVFNGSASLRDAAGQLIENVTKSVRRKETVNDEYITELYSDIISLYRLDQSLETVSREEDLGPLPRPAKVLLTALAAIWVILGACWVGLNNKRRGKKK